VGDSLNGFTDAIRRRGGIEWLHVRHEKSAAFAAGEAEATGNWRSARGLAGRAICTSSTACSMPIAAACRWWRLRHIPSPEIGSGYFQETHPEELFRECSSYCELVSNIAQMPRALEIAIRRAVAERCVSGDRHPGDVRSGNSGPVKPAQPRRCCPAPRVVPRRSVEALADLLTGPAASRCLCGGGTRARMTRW
jgi:pyruvate dehydrogenase (quinone)